jgi:transcriptional regulator with XRE-family HTH domain
MPRRSHAAAAQAVGCLAQDCRSTFIRRYAATMAPEEASIAELRREQLASFLRARRRELHPEMVGIKSRGVRRVPGLRRDEVAERAGISQSLYAWLEQGRPVTATPNVLDAVSRALCIDPVGRRYLRQLTEPYDSSANEPSQATLLPLLPILDTVPAPAYVVGRFHSLVAWNRCYVSMFGTDPAVEPPENQNAIRILLTSSKVADTMVGWEAEAEQAVAMLRHSFVLDPGNPRFFEIVEGLNQTSALFKEVWPQHRVARFTAHPVDFEYGEVGLVRTTHLSLRPPDQPDLTLMMYLPRDGESRERLATLLSA